jgi:hypothetical protein
VRRWVNGVLVESQSVLPVGIPDCHPARELRPFDPKCEIVSRDFLPKGWELSIDLKAETGVGGAREAGHSNILWMGLLTAWCCSTSANQDRHSHSPTIPRPNIGATRKSGHGMRKARLLVIWRGCSIFPCSGLVRLCSNGGSKTQISPRADGRSKPARFCFDGGTGCRGCREAA